MKRRTTVFAGLGAVLLVLAYFFLAFQPQRDALAEVEQQIQAQQDQQRLLEAQLTALRATREQAPEVEAALVAAEAIVPREAAVPAALRQLQTAAQDANATLRSVTSGRPEQVEGAAPGVSSLVLNVELRGSYFQILDTLRRLEDPTISPRGMLWLEVTLTKDDYPELVAVLTGRMFALLPEPPAPPDASAPADDAQAGTDEDAATDADETTGDEAAEETP
ncbi:hypothetical protein FTX61_09035 [Nitriliruptoraceae bacterium ZYF776]|nr:hypothetical protein [Profundirhabdus halotolerans]